MVLLQAFVSSPSPRPIDLAIFASLGALWIFGAAFIVLLYRWIIRFERAEAPSAGTAELVDEAPEPEPAEPKARNTATRRAAAVEQPAAC